MKNAGIIAEYNPFHRGHLWQIDELRHLGAKTVTVVLGGDFSQRGRPAAFSKFTRARAALLNGADLVLELPLPWCAASAEGFARGGIALLAGIGCIDTLSFGAECADAVVLQQLSRLFQQSSFDAALKTELSRGVSYPAARAAAAENFLPNSSTALNGANNILGIEYLAACRALHFAPQLAVLPRQGAAHDAALEQGGFASASALREALFAGDWDFLARFVPPSAVALYKADCACGAIYSEAAFSRSLLSRLRCMSKDELSLLPAAGGEGLANRLHRAAKSATSAEELYALVKSKRYTHARVRRLVLEAYLALPPALPALPPYLRVLGASDAGLCLLREAKGTASLPLCFSLADAEKFSGAAGQVAQLTARGDALYGLCLAEIRSGGNDYTQKFIRIAHEPDF